MISDARLTSWTLRIGVGVSAALLLVGLVTGARSGEVAPLHPTALSDLLPRAAAFEGVALIHLGLILLMLTPIARVLVVCFEFARKREFAFSLIAFGVLLLLFFSTIIGLGEGP